MKQKVVVGLSGGVDSAVAAFLLKKEGYEVLGLAIKMHENTPVEDALKVAKALQIPCEIRDMSSVFSKQVISDFIEEYRYGRTPNPCILCNRHVKWQGMLEYMQEQNADFLATGHYAEILRLQNGRYTICNVDEKKDQSYALYRLTQEQLSYTKMPLGEHSKDEVREIARSLALFVADKAESMDNCFVPDGDYAGFIEKEMHEKAEPGNFVDEEGNILGEHRGIIHYTIGQRKRLGIALGYPVYVTRIIPERNEVVLGVDENTGGKTVYADQVNAVGMSLEELRGPVRCMARIRYNHRGAFCRAQILADGSLKVEFDEPQRAITPGQSVVLYQERFLLCGGVICSQKEQM